MDTNDKSIATAIHGSTNDNEGENFPAGYTVIMTDKEGGRVHVKVHWFGDHGNETITDKTYDGYWTAFNIVQNAIGRHRKKRKNS